MKIIILLFFLGIGWGFSQEYDGLSEDEVSLINSNPNEIMRVMQKTQFQDSLILKQISKPINPKEPLIKLLAERMLLTVNDPIHGGVGIAAPQVGINRRLFLFQRFDREGNPFELAVNPEIVWESNLLQQGPEGDLSFEENGLVFRNKTIRVKYFDINGNEIIEELDGFTAIIFQHERDHLDGILLLDRIEEQKQQNFQFIEETNFYQHIN